MAVDVHIADGVSSIQLHDMWLQLFRRRGEMVKVSGVLWRQWKAAEARGPQPALTGVRCLPALSDHLRSVVSKADADLYAYDDGSLTAEEALNLIETCLNAAVPHLDDTATALVESWSVLLHLRLHDPDAPSWHNHIRS